MALGAAPATEGADAPTDDKILRAEALSKKTLVILHRIERLERIYIPRATSLLREAVVSNSIPIVPENESKTYKKLHAELVSRRLPTFRFERVSGPYYEKDLAFRAQRVRAASEHHMCKTMVMENTRATDGSEATAVGPKYYFVLVQYSASIDAEKLKAFVRKGGPDGVALAKSQVNMRMVPEEVSHELTGYGHNAVTPICSVTSMPIIVSHKIKELSDLFFLGAGEVDLKVGMRPADFISSFSDTPLHVIDCTS